MPLTSCQELWTAALESFSIFLFPYKSVSNQLPCTISSRSAIYLFPPLLFLVTALALHNLYSGKVQKPACFFPSASSLLTESLWQSSPGSHRGFQPQAGSLWIWWDWNNDSGTLRVKGFIPSFIFTVAGQVLKSCLPLASPQFISVSGAQGEHWTLHTATQTIMAHC